MALRFFWNGIKENSGKLQRCHYSGSQLISFPAGTITIYARDYKPFSVEVRAAFVAEDASDFATDYVVKEHIRVKPDHPLYGVVHAAMLAEKMHKKGETMKIKQQVLNVLKLKREEQIACFDFAVHLSHCSVCRSSGHGRIKSNDNLCQAGIDARDKSTIAARALAEVDQNFARKNAGLIA